MDTTIANNTKRTIMVLVEAMDSILGKLSKRLAIWDWVNDSL